MLLSACITVTEWLCSFKFVMFNRRTPGLAEGGRPAPGCQELFCFVLLSSLMLKYLFFLLCSFRAISLLLKLRCLYPHILIYSFSIIPSKFFLNSSMISDLSVSINLCIYSVEFLYVISCCHFLSSICCSQKLWTVWHQFCEM